MVDNVSTSRILQSLTIVVLTAIFAGLLALSAELDGADTTAGTSLGDERYPFDGLWAASDGNIGLSMVVVATGTGASDSWYFSIDGIEAECTARRSGQDHVFKNCELYDDLLTDFEVVMPADPGDEASLRLTYEGRPIRARMKRLSTRDEPESSDNVNLVWHHEVSEDCFSNTGIWAEDGLVFAPCTNGIVEVLDATTGKLRGVATLEGARGRDESAVMEVTARNGLLYAATTSNGVVIWDVTNPATPRRIGQFIQENGRASPSSVTNIHTLTLSPKGNLLFAVNQSHPRSDVRIIDVSEPRNPVEVGRYLPRNTGSLYGGAHDLALEERDGRLYAYLSQLGGGFHILDVTDPANVLELSEATWDRIFSHSGWPFKVGNKTYYAHTDEGYDQGLTILDITDPRLPKVVSKFNTRSGVSIHNIRVVDGIAYIAYYLDGLRVLDLRNPEKPVEIAHYDTVPSEDERTLFGGAWGVHLHAGLVYISDRNSGIYAFRVNLPR